MGFEAVSDSGPIIHLEELHCIKAFAIGHTCTTREVIEEGKKYNISTKLPVVPVESNLVAFLSMKYELGIGEASCLACCVHEKITLFFTDDLSARVAARTEGREPHGTIGILLRAFTEKILTKKQVIETLRTIKKQSSLFITDRLVQEAIDAVENYNKKQF